MYPIFEAAEKQWDIDSAERREGFKLSIPVLIPLIASSAVHSQHSTITMCFPMVRPAKANRASILCPPSYCYRCYSASYGSPNGEETLASFEDNQAAMFHIT